MLTSQKTKFHRIVDFSSQMILSSKHAKINPNHDISMVSKTKHVYHFKFLSIRTAEVSPAASRSLSPGNFYVNGVYNGRVFSDAFL